MLQVAHMYLRHTVRSIVKNEKGATAIEYALIAALISVVAIAAWTAVGTGVQNTMNGAAGAMTGAS